MFLLHKLLRPLRSQLLKFDDPVPAESQKVKLPSRARKACDINERQVNGIYIYDFTARSHAISVHKKHEKTTTDKKRIYYFNGGGWQMPASSQHVFMCAAIAARMPGTTLSLISYPLAPNCAAPKSFPQICDLYPELMRQSAAENETVIIAGDSAGGNIALCVPLYILNQDEHAPAPAAIMALSPSTDLRRCNPEIKETAKHDPLLTVPFIVSTAECWRAEWDAFDPRISPMAADLGVLARRDIAVHGAFGTYDVLYPDALAFRNKCAEVGIKGRWLEWEQQMHVWMLTARYGFKDAKQGLDWVAEVLRDVKRQDELAETQGEAKA